MFFRRLSAFFEKQSFETAILAGRKMSHIPVSTYRLPKLEG